MKTKIITLDPAAPSEKTLNETVRVIRKGGVLIFPTETVYGLGGDGRQVDVVNRIYEIKGREKRKPLSRLIADWKEVEALLEKAEHRRLAERFWPGPLTLILKLPDGSRQGFRFPDHIFVQRMIRRSKVPIVATSANLSREPEVATGEEAREKFSGQVDLILDGGRVSGCPSTVLDLSVYPEEILRKGPVSKEDMEKYLGHKVFLKERS